MITAKFGGTSVTAQNLCNLKHLVSSHHGCVVVSAIGKEHPHDSKVTDLLVAHFNGDDAAWQKIAEKYRRAVIVNGVNIDIDKLLFDAKNRSKKFNLAYCMSLGEELSSKIVAKFLHCNYVEAENCVRFDSRRKLLWRETVLRLKSEFSDGMGVIGGFYGGSASGGRQVFTRGGGDVSGAICAAALKSTLYENFTDVNGVCSADPKRVSDVATIPCLSYTQMLTLSEFGAEVLHPNAVRICRKYGIPICVRNTQNEFAPSTLVSNNPSFLPFLSVTEQRRGDFFSTCILHSMSFQSVFQCLSTMSKMFERCYISADCVKLTSKHSILREVYRAFCR